MLHPAQVWSALWNEYNGRFLVRHVSIGYAINRFRGNGCGFGAAYALECVTKGASFWKLLAAEISEETVRLPKAPASLSALDWAVKPSPVALISPLSCCLEGTV